MIQPCDVTIRPPRLDLTILILCLNEENSIATVVGEARCFLERNSIRGEIIVVDNNSQDRSASLAKEAGATVIVEKRKGYGYAIKAGIDAAHGRFMILGDGDGEHDLGSLEPFWEKLLAGFDFVFGNRFSKRHAPDAMPVWHRRLGSRALSVAGRLLSRASISDFHCGLRAFRSASVRALDLRSSGMEIASEMIVKSVTMNMRVVEVPVIQRPAHDPERQSHLRIWRDGWRHLRLLMLLSPRWLFFYPGCVMLFFGVLTMSMPLLHTMRDRDVFGIHIMIFGMVFLVCGTQIISLALLSSVFCESIGLTQRHRIFGPHRRVHLETIFALSSVLVLSGLVGSAWSLFVWGYTVETNLELLLHILIPSATALFIGIQLLFFVATLALIVTQGGALSDARSRSK